MLAGLKSLRSDGRRISSRRTRPYFSKSLCVFNNNIVKTGSDIFRLGTARKTLITRSSTNNSLQELAGSLKDLAEKNDDYKKSSNVGSVR